MVVEGMKGASVRLSHKRLRTLMKRSSLWYLLGDHLDDPSQSSIRWNMIGEWKRKSFVTFGKTWLTSGPKVGWDYRLAFCP